MLRSMVGQAVENGCAVLGARWYLRNASRLGSRARVWGHPSIRNHGSLVIGERVRLVSTIAKLEMSVGEGGTLEIGDNVFINYGCSIAATHRVLISSHCAIGTYVIMMDNDFHRVEPERRFETPPSSPIVLEGKCLARRASHSATRCNHRQRQRNRCRQCGGARYPAAFVCGRYASQSDPQPIGR